MYSEHNRMTSSEDIKNLFPIYDREDKPLVTVSDLKEEIEAMVANGEEIPYLAFVSGPGMNLRIAFDDYNPERHKPVVAMGLMGLIRRGATRIVVLGDVWLKEDNGVPAGDGMMILEATRHGDTVHLARCEGEKRLGEWTASSTGGTGNLGRLFERADLTGRSRIAGWTL